jgi:hypothetical protein
MFKMGIFCNEADMEGDSIHIAFGCLDVIEKPRLDKSVEDYSLSMQNESDYENNCFKS